MIRLLFYSKDQKLQPVLSATLGADFQVAVESSMELVKQLTAQEQCDVVVLDFDASYSSLEEQLELFDQIHHLPIPIVVMTDDDRRSTAMELVQRGVYDYFRKPPSLPELKIIIRRAHEHAVLRRELANAQREAQEPVVTVSVPAGCDQLIGLSARSRATYDLIHRVRNINAHVLITGASGTGKELIARAIHNESNRAGLPFVAVSCGAIPETLIEAELFGHEKGAFTGTTGVRAGYLEQAAGGTLFLDEIGELSLNAQVKLLRVLQQREFCRLGSSRPMPLRARVLCATHRDLPRMVEQGTFRQDLYFRINVMTIPSAALQENMEDLPLLAEHFLEQYSKQYEKPMYGIEPNAMDLLCAYSWPGNVRELENVIQRAIIMAEGTMIGAEDLPDSFQQLNPFILDESEAGSSFEGQLRDYKVKLATKAVEQAAGNKTKAARSLNISRAYLHRLIRGPGEDNVIN